MTVAAELRRLLEADTLHIVPTCFDALSARLAREAGFPIGFMSGAAVAATRLGMPDTGLITASEMTDQLRLICGAVPGLPVIGDGDTGYGNAVNVRRTVMDYARAGAACIMIEDQVTPKRCGHFEGKQVLPREEARMKMRAAVDAARECGILVLARTDARAVHGFEAALERCRDFEEAGADIIFLEAPVSVEELETFVRAMRKPAMANIVEGGKTPVIPAAQLEAMGVRIAVYHPLLFSAMRAMTDALAALRTGDAAASPPMASFDELKRVAGLEEYDRLSRLYACET
ncbi:MAG: isocitrate lyase/PEP mutase family protein [Hyphomicrobiaceae bacterium]|nr:isocitrate lyase/PEP mutase family protein [Hyphomicrobiaceae bacterium]